MHPRQYLLNACGLALAAGGALLAWGPPQLGAWAFVLGLVASAVPFYLAERVTVPGTPSALESWREVREWLRDSRVGVAELAVLAAAYLPLCAPAVGGLVLADTLRPAPVAAELVWRVVGYTAVTMGIVVLFMWYCGRLEYALLGLIAWTFMIWTNVAYLAVRPWVAAQVRALG